MGMPLGVRWQDVVPRDRRAGGGCYVSVQPDYNQASVFVARGWGLATKLEVL